MHFISYGKKTMDDNQQQQFDQQQEQFRIMRETEQNRIFLEMQDDAKPSKNGWKVLVAFIVIVAIAIILFSNLL